MSARSGFRGPGRVGGRGGLGHRERSSAPARPSSWGFAGTGSRVIDAPSRGSHPRAGGQKAQPSEGPSESRWREGARRRGRAGWLAGLGPEGPCPGAVSPHSCRASLGCGSSLGAVGWGGRGWGVDNLGDAAPDGKSRCAWVAGCVCRAPWSIGRPRRGLPDTQVWGSGECSKPQGLKGEEVPRAEDDSEKRRGPEVQAGQFWRNHRGGPAVGRPVWPPKVPGESFLPAAQDEGVLVGALCGRGSQKRCPALRVGCSQQGWTPQGRSASG